jgi:hypothetical protein
MLKNLALLLLAALAGFLGGSFGGFTRAEAAVGRTVSASRYELAGLNGRVVGVWDAGADGQSHLRMMSGRGKSVLDIAVLEDGSPVVRLTGADGKERVFLGLSDADKPALVMNDGRWQGRVHIGFVHPDVEDKEWDNWDVSLRPFGTERPAVGLGMSKTTSGATDAFVVIAGKRID